MCGITGRSVSSGGLGRALRVTRAGVVCRVGEWLAGPSVALGAGLRRVGDLLYRLVQFPFAAPVDAGNLACVASLLAVDVIHFWYPLLRVLIVVYARLTVKVIVLFLSVRCGRFGSIPGVYLHSMRVVFHVEHIISVSSRACATASACAAAPSSVVCPR
jgi:hypothetical protein